MSGRAAKVKQPEALVGKHSKHFHNFAAASVPNDVHNSWQREACYINVDIQRYPTRVWQMDSGRLRWRPNKWVCLKSQAAKGQLLFKWYSEGISLINLLHLSAKFCRFTQSLWNQLNWFVDWNFKNASCFPQTIPRRWQNNAAYMYSVMCVQYTNPIKWRDMALYQSGQRKTLNAWMPAPDLTSDLCNPGTNYSSLVSLQ